MTTAWWTDAGEGRWLALPVWSCPIWTKQPVAHHSEGLSPPIFSISGERPPYFLPVGVFPISQDAPPPSFAVMNDHWPSHWQPGSWCHIITVSSFRQNYQITSALKRPGRLTGRPTKETQISKKEEDFEDSLNFNRQAGIFFFFLSWPWKANYSQDISEKQSLSYFRKYRRKTSGVSFIFSLSLFSGHSLVDLSKDFWQSQPHRRGLRLGKHFRNQNRPRRSEVDPRPAQGVCSKWWSDVYDVSANSEQQSRCWLSAASGRDGGGHHGWGKVR